MSNSSEFQLIRKKRGTLKPDTEERTPDNKNGFQQLPKEKDVFWPGSKAVPSACWLKWKLSDSSSFLWVKLEVPLACEARLFSVLSPSSFLYLKRCWSILYRLASNSGNPPGSVCWTVRTKPFASSSITTDNLCNIIYSTSNINQSYILIIKPIVQVAAANAFNPSTSKAQAGSSPSSKPARSTQRNLVWGLGSGDQQNGIFQPRYGASVTNFRQSLNMLLQSALVVNAFNPSTREARRADFWIRGQPGLQNEFQDSQGYIIQ